MQVCSQQPKQRPSSMTSEPVLPTRTPLRELTNQIPLKGMFLIPAPSKLPPILPVLHHRSAPPQHVTEQ